MPPISATSRLLSAHQYLQQEIISNMFELSSMGHKLFSQGGGSNRGVKGVIINNDGVASHPLVWGGDKGGCMDDS